MTRKSKSKNNSSKASNNSVATILKQIQLNTATSIGQVVPDTVNFPILKRTRPYSVILSYYGYHVNSTTVPTYFGISIELSSLSGYSDYVATFDKYRILETQVEFIPNTGGVTTTSSATIDTVIDYDDITALGSGDAYQYDSCYTINSNQSFKRTFIPRASSAVYSGAFTSFAECKSGQWIDCASPAVKHYGLKGAVSPSTPAFCH
jgi:hypothetical protein